MKRARILALGLLVASLQGCGTGAPSAPMGFDRRPANSAETLASLHGVKQPVAQPAVAPASLVPTAPPDPTAASTHPTPDRITIFVVSDFSAPGGLAQVSPEKRAELIAAAREAQSVTLLCRGDQVRPSRVYLQALFRKGVVVKRYLVGQGIAPARVRIFARSAGAFITDNATADGRARNRRVEIHLM